MRSYLQICKQLASVQLFVLFQTMSYQAEGTRIMNGSRIAASQAIGWHVGVLHAAIATPGLRALEKLTEKTTLIASVIYYFSEQKLFVSLCHS